MTPQQITLPSRQHHRRPTGWPLVGLLSLALGLSFAPAQAAEIVPTRSVTSNGMTVLFLEQHFLPTVEIHALVKVGSAQDPPDKAGLANLTASLLDEGTVARTSRQIAEQIDFVGGSLGAHAAEDFTTASAR
ncbi:MAG: insulinase family protein, partial [Nitrospira sp.]